MSEQNPRWTEDSRIGVGSVVVHGDGSWRPDWPGKQQKSPGLLVHALFVPSEVPELTVRPPNGQPHVIKAAEWTLTVLGQPFTGGHLLVISADDPDLHREICRGECVAVALAVDDALAGGHRPGGHDTYMVARLLRDPVRLCGLADAAAH
ncbi:MAG TPA: hypothetical protein VFX16_05005 [Pseudonocardiaceae bacterium]|nr:hypothetical protein [Pseudonocardiaceae bacterium]